MARKYIPAVVNLSAAHTFDYIIEAIVLLLIVCKNIYLL